MKIVMLNGQNHNGSTYHIGRRIADKIEGENEITDFFFPKDLNLFNTRSHAVSFLSLPFLNSLMKKMKTELSTSISWRKIFCYGKDKTYTAIS